MSNVKNKRSSRMMCVSTTTLHYYLLLSNFCFAYNVDVLRTHKSSKSSPRQFDSTIQNHQVLTLLLPQTPVPSSRTVPSVDFPYTQTYTTDRVRLSWVLCILSKITWFRSRDGSGKYT